MKTKRKLTRGPNKGDTVEVRHTKRGPKQEGAPWYPVRVVRDTGAKNTSRAAKKGRKKKTT